MKIKTPKLFTRIEANKALVLIRPITSDILKYLNAIIYYQEQLIVDPATKRESQEEVEKSYSKIQYCFKELLDIGVNVENIAHGFIDFPTEKNNLQAFYSWKHDEEQVNYFRYEHESIEEIRQIYETVD